MHGTQNTENHQIYPWNQSTLISKPTPQPKQILPKPPPLYISLSVYRLNLTPFILNPPNPNPETELDLRSPHRQEGGRESSTRAQQLTLLHIKRSMRSIKKTNNKSGVQKSPRMLNWRGRAVAKLRALRSSGIVERCSVVLSSSFSPID